MDLEEMDVNDPNIVQHNPETQLLEAAQHGRLDTVIDLCKSGVNIECRNYNGLTPLHLASISGHLDVVKYLCEKSQNPNLLLYQDNLGATPLHSAATGGHLQVVKYLCQKNAKLQITDTSGRTPLHCACWWGHLDVVIYLCEQEFHIETPDKQKRTILQYAVERANIDVTRYLCEKYFSLECVNSEGLTPLHIAAEQGNLKMVEYLCSRHVYLEDKSKYGSTPLHLAAKNGHFEVVKFLSNKNVNLDCVNNFEKTALREASEYPKVAEFLRNQIFKLPDWDSPTKKSQIESIVEEKVNESLICNLRDVKGVHMIYKPIRLECGHFVCIRCLLNKISRSPNYILFCCLKCVKKIDLADLEKYQSFNFNFLTRNAKPHVAPLCEVLQEGFQKYSEMYLEKRGPYERMFNFYEYEIDLRYHSLKSRINLLNNTICNYMDKVKQDIKKKDAQNRHIHFENLYDLCKMQISKKQIEAKNFGNFKSIRNVICSRVRINDDFNNIESDLVDILFHHKKPLKTSRIETFKDLLNRIKSRTKPNGYILRQLESLVKLIKSREDVIGFCSILDFVSSNIETKTRPKMSFKEFLFNNKNHTERDHMIQNYVFEINRKLLEQCQNDIKDVVDDLNNKIFVICKSI